MKHRSEIHWMYLFFIESYNHLGWRRPWRSLSPTINLTLSIPPLNHVPKHHIYTAFKNLQGWWLHHFPGQPVPVLYNPFREDIFPNIKSTPPLVQVEAVSSQPITCYLGKRDQQPPATRFTGSLQSSGTCRGTLRRGRLVAPATVASRRAVCGEQG